MDLADEADKTVQLCFSSAIGGICGKRKHKYGILPFHVNKYQHLKCQSPTAAN